MPPEGRARSGAGPKVAVLAGVAALVLGLDAASKALVVANLTGRSRCTSSAIFEWTLLRNPGAALSLGHRLHRRVHGAGHRCDRLRHAHRAAAAQHRVRGAFGLLLGGATGNLGDRIFRAPGHVPRQRRRLDRRGPALLPGVQPGRLGDLLAGAPFVVLSLLGIHMDGTRGDRAMASRRAAGRSRQRERRTRRGGGAPADSPPIPRPLDAAVTRGRGTSRSRTDLTGSGWMPRWPGCSACPAAAAADLIAAGNVLVDGQPGEQVRPGARRVALDVTLPPPPVPLSRPGAEPVPGMAIVYEDDDIVVVDKPRGRRRASHAGLDRPDRDRRPARGRGHGSPRRAPPSGRASCTGWTPTPPA